MPNREMEVFHNPSDQPITVELGETPGAAPVEHTVQPGQTTRIAVSLRALPACTDVFADTFHYSRDLRKCHTR